MPLYDNQNYKDKYVYCLTTDSKTINIGEQYLLIGMN